MRAEARALEGVGNMALPLYGIPVAVKDNIDVRGLPTTAACQPSFIGRRRDATAVERLRAAGALILGKTNLDQFATGLVGVRTPYGIGRNLFDPKLIPGGSSAGSGARGRRRSGAACARHRHRGVGTCPRRLQQYRWAQAESRARLNRWRYARLPDARLRLGVSRSRSTTPWRRSTR